MSYIIINAKENRKSGRRMAGGDTMKVKEMTCANERSEVLIKIREKNGAAGKRRNPKYLSLKSDQKYSLINIDVCPSRKTLRQKRLNVDVYNV